MDRNETAEVGAAQAATSEEFGAARAASSRQSSARRAGQPVPVGELIAPLLLDLAAATGDGGLLLRRLAARYDVARLERAA